MSDMNAWNGGERADDPFAPGMVEGTIAESLQGDTPTIPAAVLVRSLADAYALPPTTDAVLARSRATLARRAEALDAGGLKTISSDTWSAATTSSTWPPQPPRRQHSTFGMAWRTAAAVLVVALLSASFYALLHRTSRPGGHPTPPVPTTTSTPVLAPTPSSVPAGWHVLATIHFSLAYPPDWTLDTLTSEQMYTIWAPGKHSAVQVTVVPPADAGPDMTSYCLPESSGARQTTFANLPMTFKLTGLGNTVRVWQFVNAQQRVYLLSAGDMLGSAAVQAQDMAVLATFRPDNATPWSC